MDRDHSSSIVGGIAAGAAAMYLLDPRLGRRRRALARDQIVRYLNVAEAGLGRLLHDAGNRAQGTVARTRRLLTPEELVDDRRLEARVRSTLGRLTGKASAISVEARAGLVVLSGRVVEAELGYLLTAVRRIRGVQRVESRLVAIKQLAPGAPTQTTRRLGTPPDLLQHSMSPTSRFIVGTTGFSLLASGLKRGGFAGAAGAVIGGLLIARAVTQVQPTAATPRPPAAGVTVERTLVLAVPVREAFRFWSNLQNLPRFMRHLREVRENESGTSHWVADAPFGGSVAWNAEIVALKPHQRIAWKSLDGAEVVSAGDIQFEELDNDTSRVSVRLTYPTGSDRPMLFGAAPQRQIDEDLARMQQLLEGSAPRREQSAARGEPPVAH
jgi:uncharacterized membrane protein